MLLFYRLKQMDLDGNYRFSNIVRLNYNEKQTVQTVVYPNPTRSMVTILVGDNKPEGTVASLYDINGRLLQTFKITATSQSVDLSGYMNGIYIIRLINIEVPKIVKL